MYKTKLIGIGGYGDFMISTVSSRVPSNIEIISINTDMQSQAVLPDRVTRLNISDGHGAGANPDRAYELAKSKDQAIRNALAGTDVAIIALGTGKGTGTGAGLYIAELLREMGVFSLSYIRTPDEFEGSLVTRNSERYCPQIVKLTDGHTLVSNETVMNYAEDHGMDDVSEALAISNDAAASSIIGVTSIINNAGVRNVDLNDFKATVLGSYVCTLQKHSDLSIDLDMYGLDLNSAYTAMCVIELPESSQGSLSKTMGIRRAMKNNLREDCELITGIITNPDIQDVRYILVLGFKQTIYQVRSSAGSAGGSKKAENLAKPKDDKNF